MSQSILRPVTRIGELQWLFDARAVAKLHNCPGRGLNGAVDFRRACEAPSRGGGNMVGRYTEFLKNMAARGISWASVAAQPLSPLRVLRWTLPFYQLFALPRTPAAAATTVPIRRCVISGASPVFKLPRAPPDARGRYTRQNYPDGPTGSS